VPPPQVSRSALDGQTGLLRAMNRRDCAGTNRSNRGRGRSSRAGGIRHDAKVDMYAQYRSSYPVGTPMAGPNYPFTPQANVTNTTTGFNALTAGTTCERP
jgi:hypothetical protein